MDTTTLETTKEIKEFTFENRYLSNFYGNSPIKINGWSFKTAEHFYQAMKTLDRREVKKFTEVSSPGQAKKLGQTVTLRPDWEEVKDRAMEIAVSRKFLANHDLLEKLIDTGDAQLTEGNNWHDNYWGHCFCTDCKDVPKHNKLGITLMQFRAEMQRWTDFDI